MDIAINPSLGNRCRIRPHKTGIAEGKIQRKEVCLLLHAAYHHNSFAEVGLGMAKGQSGKVLLCPQRDYHATSVANFCTAVLIENSLSESAQLQRGQMTLPQHDQIHTAQNPKAIHGPKASGVSRFGLRVIIA